MVISLEDARRVFILSLDIIFVNHKDDFHTYFCTRNETRLNLPGNYMDKVNIPVKLFKQAVDMALKTLEIHEEYRNSYIQAFANLHWIIRPRDKTFRYRKSISTRYKFYGKDTAVYCIDRIILDYLKTLNGEKVKDGLGAPLLAARRNSDGDLLYDGDGKVLNTTITTGHVSDAKYEEAIAPLEKRIERGD